MKGTEGSSFFLLFCDREVRDRKWRGQAEVAQDSQGGWFGC